MLETFEDRESINIADDSFIVPHWYMYPPKAMFKLKDNKILSITKNMGSLQGPISLYVHIPFCNMKCSFCTLFTSPNKNDEVVNEYVTNIISEIDIVTRYIKVKDISVANLYFGGGTPSILSQEQIAQIVSHLKNRFSFIGNSVLSVEFSPETTSVKSAQHWKSLGFNRVSIGVQSFNQFFLNEMNRGHSSNRCRDAIKELLDAGLTNINVDLIYGHNQQSIKDIFDDVDSVINSGANSLTLHPLAYRRKTGYEIEARPRQLGFQYELDHYKILYEAVANYLEKRGWQRTSAVSFSSNNSGHPIEEAEADGIPTIGIGAGARTYLPEIHTSSIKYLIKEGFNNRISDYFKNISKGILPISSYYNLNVEDIIRRRVILGIVGRGIHKDFIDSIKPDILKTAIVESLKKLIDYQLIDEKLNIYMLTTQGAVNASYVGAFLSGKKVKEKIGFKMRQG